VEAESATSLLNRLAEILGVDPYFSEIFQSASNGSDSNRMAPNESLVKQPAEVPAIKQNLPAGKEGNKISWNMSRGNWVDADFSGLKNLQEKFSSSNMQRCLFIGSDMSGLLLKSNNVDTCDFSGSDFSSSHIQNSNLSNNLFKDCSLNESDFSGSNIMDCDFKGSSLKESEFSGSNLMGCDFSGADFTGAVFKSGGFQNNLIAGTIWDRTSFNGMQIVDIISDSLGGVQ
jgi:uncharacterized protein YjbI with pentapeptide repeats